MSSLVEFKKDIVKKNLKPFYILCGEEIGVMNIYLNQIPNTVRESSVASIWRLLTQRGLIANESTYIVRDDKDFITNESRWKKLGDIKYGTLILLVTKVDKRSKFLKTFEDNTVTFERMTESQLVNHFSSRFKEIPQRVVEQVVDICELDYSRIDNELDKVQRLSEMTNDSINAVILPKEEFNVFKALDSITQYKPREAISQVDLMFNLGESPLGLLTLLYNTFNNASIVLGASEQTEKSLGIKQFLINKIKYEFNYSLDGALQGMDIIGKVIEGIKNGAYTEKSGTYIALFTILNLQ